MGLITDHGGDLGGPGGTGGLGGLGGFGGVGGPVEEYEAVALPEHSQGAAVFVRRSARPSRRAVLHLHELSDSLAPADLVRWYNERGFHFYLADLEQAEAVPSVRRGGPSRFHQSAFDALDAACAHLREEEGIDAIILSAQGATVLTAALWCDARPVSRPVDALILSAPEFGRSRARLDIGCPVLVISAAGQWRDTRRKQRSSGSGSIRLGQHVTWLQIEPSAGAAARTGSGPTAQGPTAQGPTAQGSTAQGPTPQRRRLFDEMGRWLGAYMYGQVRDQLL